MAATRLTAPGIGAEVGSYAASYQPFYQGLFMAPHTVAQALKSAVLAARVFEKLGFEVNPTYDEPRNDIIQAIKFKSPEKLIKFCQSIQKLSLINILRAAAYDEEKYAYAACAKVLRAQFGEDVSDLGLSERKLAVSAAGALLSYLESTQKVSLSHILSVKQYDAREHLELDRVALRSCV